MKQVMHTFALSKCFRCSAKAGGVFNAEHEQMKNLQTENWQEEIELCTNVKPGHFSKPGPGETGSRMFHAPQLRNVSSTFITGDLLFLLKTFKIYDSQ